MVAPLAATAALWVPIQASLKNQHTGGISKWRGKKHTLLPAKNFKTITNMSTFTLSKEQKSPRKLTLENIFEEGYFREKNLKNTLLHLPSLKLHCVGGCWNQTQNC